MYLLTIETIWPKLILLIDTMDRDYDPRIIKTADP